MTTINYAVMLQDARTVSGQVYTVDDAVANILRLVADPWYVGGQHGTPRTPAVSFQVAVAGADLGYDSSLSTGDVLEAGWDAETVEMVVLHAVASMRLEVARREAAVRAGMAQALGETK